MSDENVIEKVLTYIDDHIEEELSLDTIAAVFNYSKFYMARIFAKRTGYTIYKYIQGRRLTQAAQKLVETNKPIVEIAYEAQYSSQQAFTQAFSRVYQCSPQVYRKMAYFIQCKCKLYCVCHKDCAKEIIIWEVEWQHEYNSICNRTDK